MMTCGSHADMRPRPARPDEARRADGGSVPCQTPTSVPEPPVAPVRWYQRTPSDRTVYVVILGMIFFYLVSVFGLVLSRILEW